MPKKQKSHNAFYYFMLEWRKRKEREGHIYANFLEVRNDPACSEAWKDLSPYEKQVYIDLANEKKLKLTCKGKKTNIGESVILVKEQERELTEFKLKMRKYIIDHINEGLTNNKLSEYKFYFLHFNWLYITQDKKIYAPVEYAVGVFSLKYGIEKYHHKLIYIKPDLGYTWESLETSRCSHKIPPEFSEGEKDFHNLYMDLIEFLKPDMIDNQYPPFFVINNINKGVQSLLNQLTEAADSDNKFMVYSIEFLYTTLRNATLSRKCNPEDFIPIPEIIGEQEFMTDKYSFERNIECDYHKNIDGGSQFCSLAIIKRWAYTICDYCCHELGIELIPGIHCSFNRMKNILCDKLQNISLNTKRYNDTKLCSSEVNRDYKYKVSKSTIEEESKLKKNKNDKPLTIIDYAKINESPSSSSVSHSVKFERPLRPPNTKSFAAVVAGSSKNIENQDFSDVNTLLAKGRGLKRTSNMTKYITGRGHGAI
ncbi:protein maelstrom 2 isoform X1 [Vespa crabro]|uniref:protein maelstrom 2 isoform X1 n=1 Tax=Vespa crabro TaxID=7445 RepID=UPI001F008998|nr:protein maelstrom 2 isoform X1 [Vespa crabro]